MYLNRAGIEQFELSLPTTTIATIACHIAPPTRISDRQRKKRGVIDATTCKNIDQYLYIAEQLTTNNGMKKHLVTLDQKKILHKPSQSFYTLFGWVQKKAEHVSELQID